MTGAFMKDELLHTPDGVRDIYNGECTKKLAIQQKLHQILLKYGYHDIQTPTFEFFNIFGKEIGTTPAKDLYKFFDKEGNTLVLRPDFTPSIARSAVKYYVDEDMPVKLCYMGNTFVNHTDYKGRLKETTQCGAELMGESQISADAEILSMVVESLRTCGLKEFQISVGHAQFLSGLIDAAGLSEEMILEIRELLFNKNFFGVEECVASLSIPEELKKLFGLLGSFHTDIKLLQSAKEYAQNYPVILESIGQLIQLYDFLTIYGIEKYISFEPGIISDYQYYTGIIFSGYTYGTGEPVVRGGRYDKLLSYYGKNTPAIGFAIQVDQLLAALSRQKIEIDTPSNSALLVFSESHAADAIRKAMILRGQGMMIQTTQFNEEKTREDYFDYAVKNHINRVEFMDGE
jgi:ATP phosphoribosyltransferase regulatory subunit